MTQKTAMEVGVEVEKARHAERELGGDTAMVRGKGGVGCMAPLQLESHRWRQAA